ncbi:Glutaredoxin-like domain [Collimonas sp. OK307]|uniref:glutaredoxin family protein n=1 Tax=Collimonas sp. OK307 TaxID=1801620 RepID=UPI0008EB1BD4|nr:glutaredoxin family protein [Collimonas sp. OK307]SFI27058.1 Glutaredoxin-like domain [Collimonas sp. OK307]
MSKIYFTLYSRSYCHLCEDMLQALLALRAPGESDAGWFDVEVIDVDDHPDLVAKYDELVPVLSGSKDGGVSMQLCHYFLDVESVKKFLSEDD